MANAFKVVTFTKSTNTSTPVDQAITGVGFTPKAILFFGVAQTATGFNVDQAMALGLVGGTTSADFQSIGVWSDDNVATTAMGYRYQAKALTFVLSSAGTVVAEADFKSFDADGFTLTWTTNNASAYYIVAICFGGGDITNVKLLKSALQAGTGNKGYTGVGFQPDFILFLSQPIATSATGSGANMGASLGAAISSSKRWALGICAQSAQTMTANVNAQSYQRTDSCLLTVAPSSGAEQSRCDLVSMDTDGFTLNQIANGLAVHFAALCIKGGSWDLGAFNKGTSAQTTSVTGMAFKPDGYVLAGFQAIAQTSVIATSNFCLGAADGVSQVSMWSSTLDATINTEANTSFDNANTLRHETAPATNNTIGAHSAFNSDGFSIIFSPSSATNTQELWFAAKLAHVPASSQLPSAISGLQAWYKADAITGLSDGAAVGTWNDSGSGGWNLTQATAGNKPLYKTQQINNLPCVSSDGTDDYLQNASYTHASTSVTAFAVFKDNKFGVSQNRDRLAVLGTLRLWINGDLSTNGPGWYDGTNGWWSTRAGNWHYVSWAMPSGATGEVFRDGVSIGSSPFAATALAQIMLLSESGVNASQVDLAEFFFYDRMLTGTERRNLEKYLADKYFPVRPGFFNFFPTI